MTPPVEDTGQSALGTPLLTLVIADNSVQFRHSLVRMYRTRNRLRGTYKLSRIGCAVEEAKQRDAVGVARTSAVEEKVFQDPSQSLYALSNNILC